MFWNIGLYHTLGLRSSPITTNLCSSYIDIHKLFFNLKTVTLLRLNCSTNLNGTYYFYIFKLHERFRLLPRYLSSTSRATKPHTSTAINLFLHSNDVVLINHYNSRFYEHLEPSIFFNCLAIKESDKKVIIITLWYSRNIFLIVYNLCRQCCQSYNKTQHSN